MIVRLIPGDPAARIAGIEATDEQVDVINARLGLDRPLWEQFIDYVGGVFTGDFGTSFQTGVSVSQIVQDNIRWSLELAVVALTFVMVVSLTVGLLIGHLTQGNRRRRLEFGFTSVTSLVGSIPDYLLATVLTFVFAITLGVLPIAATAGWKSMIMPVAALGIPSAAILSRLVRVETLNVLSQDYIRTARSQRLPAVRVYLRHVLPNVLTASLTIGGILFAGLIGGAVVVENVYARPGLGSVLVRSVLLRDYPVIQVVILLLGVVVVLVNTVVDILLGIVDPRSRVRS